MATNSESENIVLRLGILLHRVRDELMRYEDQIFTAYGITTEQYSVLGALKYLGGSVRVTDLALALERTPNSVSMIVDRMVKVGLVKRARDRRDRRVVYVTATSKGESAFKLATPPSWEFIREILSSLSYEDKLTLLSLLETVKNKILNYANPGVDIAEISKGSAINQADLFERMIKDVLPSIPQAKRQGGKKKKAI
ncbi:MAG: MarR family winged helix-turn-helix transcriptional regulator [Dehalococcoidia bacterium]